MRSFDQIQISFESSLDTYNAISNILDLPPSEKDFKYIKNDAPSTWTYEIIEEQNDPFYDFINKFMDILENKFDKLSELGINRSDITFWYLYEYDQQCNMEFDPIRLKRLGDNGIKLCISCWDSGQEHKIN